jgi:hypothetical protein
VQRARRVAAEQRLDVRVAAGHHGGRPAEIRRGQAVDQLGRDERQVHGTDHDRAPVGHRQRLNDAQHRVARRIGLDPDRYPRQARQLGVGLGDHGNVAERRAYRVERVGDQGLPGKLYGGLGSPDPASHAAGEDHPDRRAFTEHQPLLRW